MRKVYTGKSVYISFFKRFSQEAVLAFRFKNGANGSVMIARLHPFLGLFDKQFYCGLLTRKVNYFCSVTHAVSVINWSRSNRKIATFQRKISQHCWIMLRHVVMGLANNTKHFAIHCNRVANSLRQLNALIKNHPRIFAVYFREASSSFLGNFITYKLILNLNKTSKL